MTNSSSVTAAVMTSVGVPAYVVAEVFYIQFTQRACGLSALVLMGHDIVVTSEREIKYFWKRGWSIHKVLYFLMRYFSVVAQLVSVYIFFNPTSHHICDFWLRWQVATSMLQLWFTQAVLCQIVRALYLNSRILLLIWFFFAVEMGTQIYFTVVAIPETAVYPFYPNKSVKQCGPRQGAPQVHLLWRYWLPALVFELVIFGFAFVRLWSTVADFGTGSFNLFKVRRKKATLMELILRDAMLYFVSVLVVDTASLLVFRFSNTTESFTSGYLAAFFSIVGTRIVLRLREADDQKLRGTLGGSTATALGPSNPLNKDAQDGTKRRRFGRYRRRDFSTQEISHDMAFRTVTTVATGAGELEPVSSDLGMWELDVEGADMIVEENEGETEADNETGNVDHSDDSEIKLDDEQFEDPQVIELQCVGRSMSSHPFLSRSDTADLVDPREPSPARTLVGDGRFPDSPV